MSRRKAINFSFQVPLNTIHKKGNQFIFSPDQFIEVTAKGREDKEPMVTIESVIYAEIDIFPIVNHQGCSDLRLQIERQAEMLFVTKLKS